MDGQTDRQTDRQIDGQAGKLLSVVEPVWGACLVAGSTGICELDRHNGGRGLMHEASQCFCLRPPWSPSITRAQATSTPDQSAASFTSCLFSVFDAMTLSFFYSDMPLPFSVWRALSVRVCVHACA